MISNMFDSVSHHLLIVHHSLAGDLPAQHDHASLGDSLAGNLGVRILLEVSIKNSIGDLVTHLI